MTRRPRHHIRSLLAAGELPGSGMGRSHVEGCLVCQAEVAQTRALRRQLAALRHELIPAPAGLVSLVMARIETVPALPDHRRAVLAGALVGAAAATALVVRLLRSGAATG